MFETSLECYLWDLVDEGIDDVLDRLKGEVGVSGICVPVFCPPIRQLRPHPGVSPRTFRSAGGAQFQPEVSHYAGTRLRPVTADWLRKSNPLTAVGEACTRRGLRLIARITACRSPATIERFEAHAVKDVFGDPSRDSLCPANPDVRECLRAMVEDLIEHHPIAALQLEDACFPSGKVPADPPEHADPALHVHTAWLRGLCFCESCRQLARRDGVDVDDAARSVTVTLERLFQMAAAPAASSSELIEDDPILAAYVDWRSSQVTSLVRVIREACPRPLILDRIGERWDTGEDLTALKALCDGTLSDGVNPETNAIEGPREAELALAGDVSRVHLRMTVGDRSCRDAAAVVVGTSRLAKQGIRNVTFRNYGVLPLARLEWIHQAVRFARREVDSA